MAFTIVNATVFQYSLLPHIFRVEIGSDTFRRLIPNISLRNASLLRARVRSRTDASRPGTAIQDGNLEAWRLGDCVARGRSSERRVIEGRVYVFTNRNPPFAHRMKNSMSLPTSEPRGKITILGGGLRRSPRRADRGCQQASGSHCACLRGKEFIEYDNPFDVGLTGLLGFSSGYHAMMNC